MTFLNATLVFGALAAVIPIVLHFLARREPRKVVFPSIRFLAKRFESNRSRLQVRRWWLLALRIAAVVALALALARPAIHQSLSITWLTIGLFAAIGVGLVAMATVSLSNGQSRGTTFSLAGSAVAVLLVALLWGGYTYATGPAPAIDNAPPVAMAIVLDNSPTSSWKTTDDDRIGRMQALATWMVTRLPRTSRIAIVDRSMQPVTFSLDVSSAVSKIEQLQPLEVTQTITSRMEAAARLVRGSDLTNRQILVVTDLARSTWEDAVAQTGLLNAIGDESPVAVTVFDLGGFNAVNRALSIPKIADVTPPRGVPVTLSTTLSVEGGENTLTTSVTAELQLYSADPSLPVVRDGVVMYPQLRNVDRTSVRVVDGGASELLMTIPSLDIGTHHGVVRLIGDDAVALDDVRYFSLQVLPPSSVLLVSDNDDEARVLTQAITASPVLVDDDHAEFLVERINYDDLSVVRLSDFQAIFLLDPPGEALADAAFVDFVRSGGGVFVCVGPAAGEDSVETSWLPTLMRRWRAPNEGTFFQVVAPSHPVTEPIAKGTPWSDFRVRQYWHVRPTEADTVIVRYAGTDRAACVERRIAIEQGDSPGRVLLLTTPIPALSVSNRSWNDLFGVDPWPAWLLTRQAVEYVTDRGGGGKMQLVGGSPVLPLTSQPSTDSRSQRLQLFRPDGASPVPLAVPEGGGEVVVGEVASSGTYWLRGDDPGEGFSANLPDDAIVLSQIDSAQLDAVFGPDRYALARNREQIELAENRATQRIALHSPAMLLALALFLLEQILGNRFYRSSGSSLAAVQ